MATMELTVNLHKPHIKQAAIKRSRAKRKIIRAGRRGGKTTIVSDISVEKFLDGRRVLYATPTQDQLDRFWFLSKQALREAVEQNVYYKNEVRRIIELPKTEQRIRGKTAYNADTMRGDYGDLIILDEFQDMDPDALDDVVLPMLLDNDGDLVIIYTSRRPNKGGQGLKRAHELFQRAENDKTGRWEAFSFTSLDNPHLSKKALEEVAQDMTQLSYRAEILAQEIFDDPDALWTRDIINNSRMVRAPEMSRVVVGVDPPGSPNTECGIVAAGSGMIEGDKRRHYFVIDDPSRKGSPNEWGRTVVTCYYRNLADRILGERNYGGDMVKSTIQNIDNQAAYADVSATRGKAVRAEPVAALYEQGRVHHIGEFSTLEDEQCNWVPNSGMPSPNRMDALVWAITELMEGKKLRVY